MMLLSAVVQTITVFVFCRCAAGDGLSKESVDPDKAFPGSGQAGLRSDGGAMGMCDVPPDEGGTTLVDLKGNSEEDNNERVKLFQYDPIQVGHVQYVSDESGRILELITAAVNPPVFEIQNFLTNKECDQIVKLALESGLQPSGLFPELLPPLSDGNEDEIRDVFGQLDVDNSSYLDPAELADGLVDVAGGMLSKDDVISLMTEFKMDSNEDDYLDFEEFKLTWDADMEQSVNQWVKNRLASNDTSFHFSDARVSDQTWLDQSCHEDDTLIQLRKRVVKLTQLPEDIVFSSERLQVVRYQPGGHYHAHYDSCDLDVKLRCSHTEDLSMDVTGPGLDSEEPPGAGAYDSRSSRLCRYVTVLYYLNDVEDGGETAFPVADNETFSDEAMDEMSYDLHDLSNHCYDSNLVVKPEKGKAILWYNHMINKTTGWMGEIYNMSLHGGCDVRKGEKWIANNWINIDDLSTRQMNYHEFYKRELEIRQEARDRDRFAPELGDKQTTEIFTRPSTNPDEAYVKETARETDEL